MADMWGRLTPRVGRTWTASRLGALWGGVAPTQPQPEEIRFPQKGSRGVALPSCLFIHSHTISHVREKSSVAPPLVSV